MLTLKWGTVSGTTEGVFDLEGTDVDEREEVTRQPSTQQNFRHVFNASIASAIYQNNAGLQPSALLSLVAIRY